MLYPLLWMLSASFRPQDLEIFSTTSIIPSSISFDAFARGWNGLQVSFGPVFINSFIISVLCVIPGNLFACSVTAFAFARLQFWGKNFWFALMLGTLMLPYQVTLIPQYVLFLNLGWVNTFPAAHRAEKYHSPPDLFFIFLMVQFFRGIPRELDAAASIDGCNAFQTYWKIMLPLSTPVLGTAAIFTFIFTWDDFFEAADLHLNDTPKNYTAVTPRRSAGLKSDVSTAQSD